MLLAVPPAGVVDADASARLLLAFVVADVADDDGADDDGADDDGADDDGADDDGADDDADDAPSSHAARASNTNASGRRGPNTGRALPDEHGSNAVSGLICLPPGAPRRARR